MPHHGVSLSTVLANVVQAFNNVRIPQDVTDLSNEYFDQNVTLYRLHNQGHFYHNKNQVAGFLSTRLIPSNPQLDIGTPDISNTQYLGAVISDDATWTEGGRVDSFSLTFTFINDPNNGWLFTGMDGLVNN
jgi:hypothetical protein